MFFLCLPTVLSFSAEKTSKNFSLYRFQTVERGKKSVCVCIHFKPNRNFVLFTVGILNTGYKLQDLSIFLDKSAGKNCFECIFYEEFQLGFHSNPQMCTNFLPKVVEKTSLILRRKKKLVSWNFPKKIEMKI